MLGLLNQEEMLLENEEDQEFLGNQITKGKDVLTKSVFKEIEEMFRSNKHIYIKEYVDVRETMAEITYVGRKFATVKLPSGYSIAINYGGILDNQNQKNEIVSQIKFI